MSTPAASIIFIADDDPEDMALLEEAIRNHKPSVTVLTFRNSDELLKALLEQSGKRCMCLIVMDFNMPPVTGPEVLSMMKCHPPLHNIPKVIWSSSNNAEHIKACFANGATAYFTKPFSLKEYEELAAKICAHLKDHDILA